MKKVSREKIVNSILNSGGRMLTVRWKTKGGRDRSLNGKFLRVRDARRNQDKIFGLLTMYDVHKKGIRRVDTRTINELHMNKTLYKVR